MFIDGKTEIKYKNYFEGDCDEHTLQVEIGGPASMGSVLVDGKLVLIESEHFFFVLRKALNDLWENRGENE